MCPVEKVIEQINKKDRQAVRKPAPNPPHPPAKNNKYIDKYVYIYEMSTVQGQTTQNPSTRNETEKVRHQKQEGQQAGPSLEDLLLRDWYAIGRPTGFSFVCN